MVVANTEKATESSLGTKKADSKMPSWTASSGHIAGLAMAVALVGCGGGGGGSASSTSPPVTPPITPTSTLVTTKPVTPYPAGSAEAQAFEALNAQRVQCGYGYLTANSSLDTALAAHLEYVRLNDILTHDEVAGNPGFYAASPTDRAVKAGYAPTGGTAWAGDYLSGATQWGITGSPSVTLTAEERALYAMRKLMSGPLHMVVATLGAKDVSVAKSFGDLNIFGIFLAVKNSSDYQQPATNEVRTYPCEGTTGTFSSSTAETPAPFPDEGTSAVWGQPILVTGHSDLNVTTVTFTGPSGAVAIKKIQKASDGQFWIAPMPLKTNANYAVSISGTNMGAAFKRDFTFSTGNYSVNGIYRAGQF